MYILLIVLTILVLYYLFTKPKYNEALYYSPMKHEDVEDIQKIESRVYEHINEIPLPSFVHELIDKCPEFTMVVRDGKGVIVGAMYGGMMNGTTITMRTLNNTHDPEGDTLTIYSMCVRNDLRGRGIGKRMCRHYYETWISNQTHVKYISNVVRKRHIKWYKELGFSYMGPSNIKIGKEPWFSVVKINNK